MNRDSITEQRKALEALKQKLMDDVTAYELETGRKVSVARLNHEYEYTRCDDGALYRTAVTSAFVVTTWDPKGPL